MLGGRPLELQPQGFGEHIFLRKKWLLLSSGLLVLTFFLVEGKSTLKQTRVCVGIGVCIQNVTTQNRSALDKQRKISFTRYILK